MRLYVSGRMSDLPGHNYPAFHQAAAELRAAGYDVDSPAEGQPDTPMTWADYMRADIPRMLACDGVATLDGWRESRGARLEVYIAGQLGMPVRLARHWIAEAAA